MATATSIFSLNVALVSLGIVGLLFAVIIKDRVEKNKSNLHAANINANVWIYGIFMLFAIAIVLPYGIMMWASPSHTPPFAISIKVYAIFAIVFILTGFLGALIPLGLVVKNANSAKQTDKSYNAIRTMAVIDLILQGSFIFFVMIVMIIIGNYLPVAPVVPVAPVTPAALVAPVTPVTASS